MNVRIPYKMTVAQQKAAHEEIKRQVIKAQDKYDLGEAATTLYAVASFFGLGEKRIKQFFAHYYELHKEFKKRYEMEGIDDYEWYCDLRLKEKGVDVKALWDAQMQIYAPDTCVACGAALPTESGSQICGDCQKKIGGIKQ